MESIKTYLLSVIAAAIICGIVVRIIGEKGTMGAMAKLLAGLFLAFTMIRPLANVHIDGIANFTDSFSDEASRSAVMGEAMAKDALSASIKAQVEAYILDKAGDMNVSLTVEVTVSEDEIPVPTAVRIKGAVSPYAKKQLQALISEDLGIEKERQTWI